jgi:hypothetical protein
MPRKSSTTNSTTERDPLDHDGDGRKGGSLPRNRTTEQADPKGPREENVVSEETARDQTDRVNSVSPDRPDPARPSESEMLDAQGKLTRESESEKGDRGGNPIADRMSEGERRVAALESGREYTVPQKPEPETDGKKTPPSPELRPAGATLDGTDINAKPLFEPNRNSDAPIGSVASTIGIGHVNDSTTEAMRGTSGKVRTPSQ